MEGRSVINVLVIGIASVMLWSSVRRNRLWMSFFSDGAYGGPDGWLARWGWILNLIGLAVFIVVAASG